MVFISVECNFAELTVSAFYPNCNTNWLTGGQPFWLELFDSVNILGSVSI